MILYSGYRLNLMLVLYILIQIEEQKRFGIVFLYIMRMRSISGVEKTFQGTQRYWISYLLT